MSESKQSLLDVIRTNGIDYFELLKKDISLEDVADFNNALIEYYKRRDEYDGQIVGRREFGNELSEEAGSLIAFLYILSERLKRDKDKYQSANNDEYPVVTDFRLTMNVLLRLANSKGEKYAKKKYNTWHNSPGEPLREVIIIGDKSILDSFETRMPPITEIGTFARNLVTTRNSLIISTQNSADNFIIPEGSNAKDVVEHTIKCDSDSDWINSNLYCFLFEDELRNATEKFLRFVKKNGPDIKGMSEDKLFEEINKSPDIEIPKRKGRIPQI